MSNDYRTQAPKLLKTFGEMVAYAYEDVALKRLEEMVRELQDITIYPPPLYIMSPRIRVYIAKDIKRFKGYISKCEPNECEETGEPEMTITITPIEPTAEELAKG